MTGSLVDKKNSWLAIRGAGEQQSRFYPPESELPTSPTVRLTAGSHRGSRSSSEARQQGTLRVQARQVRASQQVSYVVRGETGAQRWDLKRSHVGVEQ